MKNKLTVSQMMKASKKLNEKGEKFTMLGIGPMSKTLIYAVLDLAKERDFPIMLIASRNQVDSDEFGGGYVCLWDQKRFADDVESIAKSIGFDGLVYLCRDHGGPWQRDEERAAKLPVDEAMDIAKRSYLNDINCGFDLLHIDPTKDPHAIEIVSLDIVLSRTIELIEYLEKKRIELGLPEVAYEVGTEETSGGLTNNDVYETFIKTLVNELKQKGLPLPEFVVGQTGTLTRLTENVGNYNYKTAKELSSIASKYGLGLKEHNGDYLANTILLEHPVGEITATNVAPEFGVVETRAYLELAECEVRLVAKEKCSNVRAEITKQAVLCERWRKWMVGADIKVSVDSILQDAEKSAQITDICGHYTFETPSVKAELKKMFDNLDAIGIDANGFAIKQLKDSIDRYAYCFGMYGLTTKLLNA